MAILRLKLDLLAETVKLRIFVGHDLYVKQHVGVMKVVWHYLELLFLIGHHNTYRNRQTDRLNYGDNTALIHVNDNLAANYIFHISFQTILFIRPSTTRRLQRYSP